jgi:hypothetical protein
MHNTAGITAAQMCGDLQVAFCDRLDLRKRRIPTRAFPRRMEQDAPLDGKITREREQLMGTCRTIKPGECHMQRSHDTGPVKSSPPTATFFAHPLPVTAQRSILTTPRIRAM